MSATIESAISNVEAYVLNSKTPPSDEWCLKNYGITWYDYALHGCSIGYDSHPIKGKSFAEERNKYYPNSVSKSELKEEDKWETFKSIRYPFINYRDGSTGHYKAKSIDRKPNEGKPNDGKRYIRVVSPKTNDNAKITASGFFPTLNVESDGKPIYISEGEEKAIVLHKAGFRAVTPTTGSKGFDRGLAKYLIDRGNREFAIVMDNDNPGKDGCKITMTSLVAAAKLEGVEIKIRYIDWQVVGANLKDGYDVNDLWKEKPNDFNKFLSYDSLIEATEEDYELPIDINLKFNDTYNSNVYREFGDGKIIFIRDLNEWWAWDGCRWSPNAYSSVMTDVTDKTKTELKRRSEAVNRLKRAVDSKSHPKVDLSFEDQSKIKSMREMASEYMGINQSDFNKSPMLLNLKNGIYDLESGKLLKHDPKQYHVKVANASYDPVATCPKWKDFLNESFDGNVDLIDYFQRVIGYSITGSTDEQEYYVIHGNSGNGKTTCLNVLGEVFGDYAVTSKTGTFCEQKYNNPGSANSNLDELEGARFINNGELNSDEFNINLILNWTGQHDMKSRILYQKKDRNWRPVGKLFFTSNELPKSKATGDNLYRRMVIIPFIKETVIEEKRNNNLTRELLEEREGILNWAIEGCKKWQEYGLKKNKPQAIVDILNVCRTKNDPILEWLQSGEVFEDLNSRAPAQKAYDSFSQFCISQDIEKVSNQDFKDSLEGKGFKRIKSSGNFYLGLRLS